MSKPIVNNSMPHRDPEYLDTEQQITEWHDSLRTALFCLCSDNMHIFIFVDELQIMIRTVT